MASVHYSQQCPLSVMQVGYFITSSFLAFKNVLLPAVLMWSKIPTIDLEEYA